MEVNGQLHAPATLPAVPIEYEAGWAPEAVWTRWQREKKSYNCPCRELNPCRPTRSSVCILTDLPQRPIAYFFCVRIVDLIMKG